MKIAKNLSLTITIQLADHKLDIVHIVHVKLTCIVKFSGGVRIAKGG